MGTARMKYDNETEEEEKTRRAAGTKKEITQPPNFPQVSLLPEVVELPNDRSELNLHL